MAPPSNSKASSVTKTRSKEATNSPQAAKTAATSDLACVVDDLLSQMQTRFDGLGTNIMSRMDEMSKRMDELEQSVGEIMDQAGLEREAVLPRTPQSTSTSMATAEI